MKKKLFCVMYLFFVLSCDVQNVYRIEGQVENFADGSKVSLILAATHRDEKPELETIIQNGTFSFSGEIDSPKLYMLSITEPSGCKGMRPFMLENSKITIVASKGNVLNSEYMEFAEFEVKGSVFDKVFREKLLFRDELDKQYKNMHEKYKDINAKLDRAYENNDNKEVQRLKSTEDYKAFVEAETRFFYDVENAMFMAFKKNNDSFWGPLLMLYNISYFAPTDPNFSKYLEIYESYPEEVQNSFYGKILKNELGTKTLTGKEVPGFFLPDKDGKMCQNTELAKGKKLLLIDFWASWCAPCRKSIPELKEIYEKFSKQGLEIISISIDKNKADWLKALGEENFPWPSLWDTQNTFSDKFNGKAIPTFVLVDGNGLVLSDTVTILELEQKIAEIL